ncbi:MULTISPECIES: alginate lyase family protein [unclassified Nocardia]|uniref:alginate lyase family protein n=1 Tax=unclassified Nocardia TaxID=2637762 RepID=UPI001CE43FF7|nr:MULTISPECIES: alginate lyase family protein [unclassified Nocardia]
MRYRNGTRRVAILVAVTVGLLSGCAAPHTVARAHAAPAAFVHPGVLVSREQLDLVKVRLAVGLQPWKSAYDKMIGSEYASATHAAKPRPVVDCGPYDNPNNGCSDERRDAIAAYTDALAWYLSGDIRYAHKAIEIMDAWSAALTDHTGSNASLQSGWAASMWTRAAEIIKYAYGDWPNSGRFGDLLRNVYLPKVINGSSSNGNWELTEMEAAIGIAVFLEDRPVYDKAVGMYLDRVPAYIYLTSDGPQPKIAGRNKQRTPEEITKYWYGQTTLVDGLAQETCRDFAHTGYGLSAIAHIAETGRIQHQDLYPQVADRLRAAFELHAKYQLGEPMPDWLCGGHLERALGQVTEVGYNALHNRMGLDMPYTGRLTEQQRPTGADMFSLWETLTHADNPA